MPTLEWIGKEKVINHHLQVPFRVLERSYSYGHGGQHKADNGSNNMIIHGDNLEALKALLPAYEGKIKCIYIDPPYNTGNEGWIYNDNVNDPKIKKWLGEVVGKEGEDLSRHDKWLCMMYPRLRLLQKLLADDGVIFISIDDNESAYLKLVLDEIFGVDKFIAQLIWKSRQNKDNRNINNVSIDHEYIFCYGKKLRGCFRETGQYSNPDDDPRGAWVSANMVGLATENERPNLHYDLIDPITGINYGRPLKGWRYDINTMQRLIDDNRIIWPASKSGRPRKKQFLADLEGLFTGYSSIVGQDFFTRDGTKELTGIFGETKFAFPKSANIVTELLTQATAQDDIILDSFAGSGTTAHAVLNMNKADGGNRQFILVEMMDYAEDITAERVRRVIDGYGEVEGTGGDFSFYELGESLFLPDDNLNPAVKTEKVREYIYYMETRQALPKDATQNEPYLLGSWSDAAYYFYFEKEAVTTLDYTFLSQLSVKATAYVIYADLCTLSEEELQRKNIIFKKIPRDIARL